jgi:hypothetical protein
MTSGARPGTETRRTLVACVSSEVGPGCGRRWLDLEWDKRARHVGHGMYARVETILVFPWRPCPTCGGRCVSYRQVEVKKSRGGKCLSHCQTSDSRKCNCACGGRKHGIALDPFMVHIA